MSFYISMGSMGHVTIYRPVTDPSRQQQSFLNNRFPTSRPVLPPLTLQWFPHCARGQNPSVLSLFHLPSQLLPDPSAPVLRLTPLIRTPAPWLSCEHTQRASSWPLGARPGPLPPDRLTRPSPGGVSNGAVRPGDSHPPPQTLAPCLLLLHASPYSVCNTLLADLVTARLLPPGRRFPEGRSVVCSVHSCLLST